MRSSELGAASFLHRSLLAPGVGLVLLGLAALVVGILAGCSSGLRHFSTAPPVWRDDDRHPFKPKPDESFVPLYWDGADHIFFRPVSHAFLLETAHEARNVNALDEVPDSSWFTNRIGRRAMTVEEVARGPCAGRPPSEERPWTVAGVKIDGANPGFRIKTSTGTVYVLKFDDPEQWERASAADVVGSRLYHAAGFHVPCNRVVFLRPQDLELPEHEIKDPGGKTLTAERIEEMLKSLPREPDGRIRALASQFLKGKPLGPWDYSGTWKGDPNDVIPHEDRRELRGSRLLGAWINHHDARSQNTLAMWVDDGGGRGHVEHDLLDWGDTLGGLTQWDSLSRRVGYSYYIDFGAIGADFVTFGAVERPWERAKFGSGGEDLRVLRRRPVRARRLARGLPESGVLGDAGERRGVDGADHLPPRRCRHRGDRRRGAASRVPIARSELDPHPPRSAGSDPPSLPPPSVVASSGPPWRTAASSFA